VVEEAGENHGQAIGKLYHLRLRVECTLFVIYKAGLFCNSYTCQFYIFFCFRTEVEMSGIECIAVSKYSTKKHLTNPAVFVIHLSEYS
jgi:hypothetical protein